MKTVKIDDAELKQAIVNLRVANSVLATAKKNADNAKETITNKLRTLRDINLETLAIGDLVCVDKLLIVEIGKQNRFDEANFQLQHPTLHAQYKKDFATKKFKALV